MSDLTTELKDYVQTANDPAATTNGQVDWNLVNSHFPLLKDYNQGLLKDYVKEVKKSNPTTERDWNNLNTQFPEFFGESGTTIPIQPKTGEEVIESLFKLQDGVDRRDSFVQRRAADEYFMTDDLEKNINKWMDDNNRSTFKTEWLGNTSRQVRQPYTEKDLMEFFGNKKYQEYINWKETGELPFDNDDFDKIVSQQVTERQKEVQQDYLRKLDNIVLQKEALIMMPDIFGTNLNLTEEAMRSSDEIEFEQLYGRPLVRREYKKGKNGRYKTFIPTQRTDDYHSPDSPDLQLNPQKYDKILKLQEDWLKTSMNTYKKSVNTYNDKVTNFTIKNQKYVDELAKLDKEIEELGDINADTSLEVRQKYLELANQYNGVISRIKESGLDDLRLEVIDLSRSLETRFDDLMDKSEKYNNIVMATEALNLNYNWSARFLLQIENFFSDMKVLGTSIPAGISELTEKIIWNVDDGAESEFYRYMQQNYKAAINYSESVKNRIQSELPKSITWETKGGNLGAYMADMLANNSMSIMTAIASGGVGSIATKGMSRAGAMQVRKRIANYTTGIFFGMESGSKLADIEISKKNAPKHLKDLKKLYENAQTPAEKYELLRLIDQQEAALSVSGFEKAFSTIAYGGIAAYAERLGTLNYIHGLSRWSRIGAMQGPVWKKGLYGTGNTMFNMGIEWLAETGTMLGHNLIDIAVLDEDKSLVDGIDMEFTANVLFSSLAIQGPTMGMNSYSAINSAVSSRKDRKKSNSLAKELIDIQETLTTNTNLKPAQRKELVQRKRDILKEASLQNSYSLMRVARMKPQEIRDMFEINRENRKDLKTLRELGMSGESVQGAESLKQEIVNRIEERNRKKETLLSKPAQRRRAKLQAAGAKIDLQNKAKVSKEGEVTIEQEGTGEYFNAETDYWLARSEYNEDVVRALGDNLQKFEGDNARENYKNYLEKQNLPQEEVQKALNEFDQGAYGANIGNSPILFGDNILRGIINGGFEAKMAAATALHEAQHVKNKQSGLVKNGYVVDSAKRAVEEIRNRINELGLDEDTRKGIENRIAAYDGMTEVNLEELINLAGDLKDAGIMSRESLPLAFAFKSLLNSTINLFRKDKDMYFMLDTVDEVLQYIDSFQQKAKAGGVALPPEEEAKEGPEKQSLTAEEIAEKEERVNELGRMGWNNETWKSTGADFAMETMKTEKLLDALIYSKYKADQVPSNFVDLVYSELTPDVQRFNEDLWGTEQENDSLFGYLMGRLQFRADQVYNREFKKDEKPTVRLDEKTKEGEIKRDIASTDLTPEEQMIAKEEAAKKAKTQKTDKQKRDIFLKRVGFDNKVKQKIIDSVIKTFGTKLPAVTSKQFRLALQRAFETELKNVIQKEFGIGKNYDLFLKTLFPTVFKRLTPEQLTQIERRVPKDKKIFSTRRRITKKAEVEQLQNEGLIAMDVDYKTGPWLSTKMKTPSIKQTMAFFRGENMQEVLGYTVSKSTFGTRKDALAEALAVELAFDSAMEVLNDPKILERRQDIETLQGREKAENYVVEAAQKIRRDPNIKLSRAVDNNASDRSWKLFIGNRSEFLNKISEYGYSKQAIKRAYDEVYKPLNLKTKEGKSLRTVVVNSYSKIINPFLKINERYKKGQQEFPQTLEEYVSTVDLADAEIQVAIYFKLDQAMTDLFKNPTQKKQYQEFLTDIALNIKEKNNLSNQELAIMLLRAQSHMENGTNNPRRSMAFYKNEGFAKGMLSLVYPDIETYKKHKGKVTILGKKGKVLDTFNIPVEPTQGVTQDMIDNSVSKEEKAARKESSDFHWNYLNMFLEEASSLVKNKQSKYSKNEMAMLAAGFLGNMKTSLRASALFKYAVLNPFDKNHKNYEYEHGIPALVMMMHLLDHHFAGKKVDLGKLKESYAVGAIHDDMNTNLGVVFKKRMHFDYKLYDMAPKRWYNIYTAAGATHAVVDIYNGNKFGEIQAKSWKDIKKLKDELDNKQVKENKKLSNAILEGRKTVKSSKGITVLDFDDTLATTESLVRYTAPDGTTGTLNAEQYASTYQDLQAQGYTFDFSEFNKVVGGKIAPLFKKALKLQGKFGSKSMFVLTARPPQAQKAIYDFLRANGLNIPLKNITGLGNSTAEAKALWIADKVGEGFNDFYFADDALQNVQAVKNMLDQFDVKSKVQQARIKFSKGMSGEFNEMLERRTGIDAKKRFSLIKGKLRGKGKGRFRYFIPPSHEDFLGLLYNFMGSGKQGNLDRDFLEKALLKPLNKGYTELNAAKQAVSNDYKNLIKKFPDTRKKLTKKIPDSDFTYGDAVRVYLWDKAGFEIPGMSKKDQAELVELVKEDVLLQSFGDAIGLISRQKEGYTKPGQEWQVGDVRTDLAEATEGVGRQQFLNEFIENADIIFSQENLNKIEAAYGSNFREALEDMLYRIKTGRSRPTGKNRLVNTFTNWVNGAVGSTMFLNSRSALLQQLSIVNFLNFGDNNIFKASAAFANQLQFWKDYAKIFNSDFLKQRRSGTEFDINGAELAKVISKSKQPIRAAIRYLLSKGFILTQLGDSNAIALGGSTFYRNRVNTYLKQGLSQKEAESKAWVDFVEMAEMTQQSARPDMTSQQQNSPLGMWVLAFQNVTSQYNRFGIKRPLLDLIHRRKTPPYKTQWQSDMSNFSRLVYYSTIQNLIFYGLQTALFAMMFSDEEEDKEFFDQKRDRIINGSLDSLLRGSGIGGGVISVIKNAAMKIAAEQDKTWGARTDILVSELLQWSPPIGIKARKFSSAEKTWTYNKKVIKEMEVFDIDNPIWDAIANVIEGGTNIPLARLHRKIMNLRAVTDGETEYWQKVFLMLGWSQWQLGLENVEIERIKKEIKNRTKDHGKTRIRKTKTRKTKIR